MAEARIVIPGAAGKPEVEIKDPAVDYPVHEPLPAARGGYKGPVEPTLYAGADKVPAAGTGDIPVGPVHQFKKGK